MHEEWKEVPKLIIHIPMRSFFSANFADPKDANNAINVKKIYP
jgi:hypothetical protein